MAKAQVLVPISIRDIFDDFLNQTNFSDINYSHLGRLIIDNIEEGPNNSPVLYFIHTGIESKYMPDVRFQASLDNVVIGMLAAYQYMTEDVERTVDIKLEECEISSKKSYDRFSKIASRLK